MLILLGRLKIGQSPRDQDKVFVETAYDEFYQELKSDGLATWASDGAVPSEVTRQVVALIAIRLSNDFGISNARYTRIKVESDGAMRDLRKFVTPKYESLEEPDDF